MTQAELKALLDYNPDSGVFSWRKSTRATRAGAVAGTRKRNGYLRIGINLRQYSAHRLAFLWMTGAWPDRDVDHINGVRDDNRWANLRQATEAENCQNLGGPTKNNKSGALGVHYHKGRGKFRADIRVGKKSITLGYFDELWEASAAYLRAKDELHPTHKRLRNQTEQEQTP